LLLGTSVNALTDCQTKLADPQTFKDPAKPGPLRREYDELTARLKGLEQEYFAREK